MILDVFSYLNESLILRFFSIVGQTAFCQSSMVKQWVMVRQWYYHAVVITAFHFACGGNVRGRGDWEERQKSLLTFAVLGLEGISSCWRPGTCSQRVLLPDGKTWKHWSWTSRAWRNADASKMETSTWVFPVVSVFPASAYSLPPSGR